MAPKENSKEISNVKEVEDEIAKETKEIAVETESLLINKPKII